MSAGIPKPRGRWARIVRSLAIYDVIGALWSFLPAAVGAWRAYLSPTEPTFIWKALATAAIGALLVQGRKAYVGLLKEMQRASSHDLEGALHTLETVLLGPDLEPAKRVATGLRLTVYVPDPQTSGSLIQAMDYVGCQRKIGTLGRRVAEGEGVVGRAFRMAKLEPENPAILDGQRSSYDHDGFVAEMVSCYGFSKERAAALSPATRSWLAYPISANRTVYGVIYCDSKRVDFFTQNRKTDLLHAMAGIAYFVTLRYPDCES
jgi:hypothetical protein